MIHPFSADHEQFRGEVRRFVERDLRPHADRWERGRRLPRRALLSCVARWASTDRWRQAVIAEELPRCDSLGFALSVFVQSNLIAPLVDELGTPAQKDAWLEPIRKGRALGALAVSEPDAGSDVAAISTRGRRRAGRLVIDGRKTYVTNGAAADVLIVAVRTEGEGLGGLSLVLVPRTTRGLIVEPLETLGLVTSAMGRVTLRGCRVPMASILGRPGAAFGYIQRALTAERMVGSLAAVAWAAYALDRAIAWARRRRVFGQPMVRFQAIRHQIVDADDRPRSRTSAQLRDVRPLGPGSGSDQGGRHDQGVQLPDRAARALSSVSSCTAERASSTTTGPRVFTATPGR